MWQVKINALAKQKKILNSYFFYTNYYLTKKTNLGKSLLNFFIKYVNYIKLSFELIYIFFGLIILGINNTPKTNSNNGAIITKNDSVFIKT